MGIMYRLWSLYASCGHCITSFHSTGSGHLVEIVVIVYRPYRASLEQAGYGRCLQAVINGYVLWSQYLVTL